MEDPYILRRMDIEGVSHLKIIFLAILYTETWDTFNTVYLLLILLECISFVNRMNCK